MPEVILVRPLSHDRDERSYMRFITIPHGPLTLAAHLIDKGISVKIIDEVAEIDAEHTLKECLKEYPVCVGISTMTGKQIQNGLRFASIVRKFDDTIPLVWGGAHPTIVPLMTLKDPLVDIVVFGEGDISFPILVQRLKDHQEYTDIKGICCKTNNGEVIKNAPADRCNLNGIPRLPYHLIHMEEYIRGIKKKYISRYFEVVSSRGCPFKCSFCSNSIEQSSYTKRDAQNIVSEIEYLTNEYHIDGIGFGDENFILDKQRIIEICNELIKLNSRLFIRAGGRVDLFSKLDDSTLNLMKQAGFYHFGFGVESGSQRTLDMIRKGITLEQVYDVIHKINRFGFMATYNFMGGLPHEELSEYKKTLELIYYIFQHSRNIVYPVNGPGYYTPFPGTVSFEEVVKLGYLPPTTFREWAELDYNNAEMPWLNKQFRHFLRKSKQIVNEINEKSIGDASIITNKDLHPLKEIMQ